MCPFINCSHRVPTTHYKYLNSFLQSGFIFWCIAIHTVSTSDYYPKKEHIKIYALGSSTKNLAKLIKAGLITYIDLRVVVLDLALQLSYQI